MFDSKNASKIHQKSANMSELAKLSELMFLCMSVFMFNSQYRGFLLKCGKSHDWLIGGNLLKSQHFCVFWPNTCHFNTSLSVENIIFLFMTSNLSKNPL